MKLTTRQQAIIDFISRHIEEKGYSPTLREIGEAVGLKSTSTVHGHIERLEKQGLIKHIPSSPRSIQVVERDDETVKTIMRRRVAIKVIELTADGTFKTLLIGKKRYVFDPMG